MLKKLVLYNQLDGVSLFVPITAAMRRTHLIQRRKRNCYAAVYRNISYFCQKGRSAGFFQLFSDTFSGKGNMLRQNGYRAKNFGVVPFDVCNLQLYGFAG